MGVSERASNIPPFIVMDVLERAQELAASGKEIIHLEVGEPDFATPEVISQAAVRALSDGHTHYTHSLGVMELQGGGGGQHYAERYGVDGGPGPGADHLGYLHGHAATCFRPCWRAGQEIILSDPHYACYDNFISFVGGAPRAGAGAGRGGLPVPARAEIKALPWAPRPRACSSTAPPTPPAR